MSDWSRVRAVILKVHEKCQTGATLRVLLLALLLSAGGAGAIDVGVLRGQLAEGRTGKPVSSAVVIASCTGSFAFTDDNGTFQFADLPTFFPDCLFGVFEPAFRPLTFTTDLNIPPNTVTTLNPALDPIALRSLTVTRTPRPGLQPEASGLRR